MAAVTVITPPIKSQGIKTKLVPWINDLVYKSGLDINRANWIEPFFGTGVVGINTPVGGRRVVGDSNPHIISFYQSIQDGIVTSGKMREYLMREGELLEHSGDGGYEHYRLVKNRFNEYHNPFDFIFLSRSGFNGMMRFNRRGEWNIPFCKKPNRFAPAYITKICNQVMAVSRVIGKFDWKFCRRDFTETIREAKRGDIIYCDPPYYGRNVDYYNGWTEDNEQQLFEALKSTEAYFILSTWHHNEYRANDMIDKYWGQFNVLTQEHFYHSGGHIENRHAMTEALIFNFEPKECKVRATRKPAQLQFDFAK